MMWWHHVTITVSYNKYKYIYICIYTHTYEYMFFLFCFWWFLFRHIFEDSGYPSPDRRQLYYHAAFIIGPSGLVVEVVVVVVLVVVVMRLCVCVCADVYVFEQKVWPTMCSGFATVAECTKRKLWCCPNGMHEATWIVMMDDDDD